MLNSQIEKLVISQSGRIYEHAANDSDFLTISLGASDVSSSYTVKRDDSLSRKDNDGLLIEMREIANEFSLLKNVSSVIDLKKSHLALVGEKNNIHTQLKSILAQICFFQSYHDIEVITLVEEDDLKTFDWMRWLPHCKIKSINIQGLISAENHRDLVLGNLAQVLKTRLAQKQEEKKDSAFLPHYIFVVDNPKLLTNHSIMEYLQNKNSDLGFSIIYTTHLKTNVPENIETIFMIEGKEKGTLLINNGQLVNSSVSLSTNEEVKYEKIARSLAPIGHNKGVTTHIPESITFFDIYNVKTPREIPIEKLWKKNACHKSLAVPLGMRAKDDLVYLNLHEKAHGPHGLVAGTTGSGKSEIVQSYILSLAVNFHPHEVGFLLIDYKGGGMANLFEKLPHLLGTITNLDGSESMRALASIKSELARRQRVFNSCNVNNINQYTKLFKSGEAEEPLPHLFIISDEFAELKKEQPEFMNELVSAARIGRSLGVHLILATQKPSGVVDDQIWSNSKFKLALKVQNEGDSNEVLKTPDAARITQPGRAYLQVGNNEIYELFQSAWSGASYNENQAEQSIDNRIYEINKFGQGELINEDLSAGNSSDSKLTQLDVVVNLISEIYEKQNPVSVTKPWVPSLPQNLLSPHVKTGDDVGLIEEYDLDVAIGMVDVPEEQLQTEYKHDFTKDGNISFFGAAGFGKSIAVTNMALSLSCNNSPLLLNYYILDFGNSSLIQLKDLPHTADYITFDDSEKLKKLEVILSNEMKKRKELFAKKSAINFTMYNQIADEKLSALIIFIDNYDVIREMDPEFEEFLTRLTRDGNGVGIYTVACASRSSAIRYTVANNFKTKISLFMHDASEVMSVVGRSTYVLPEIRGRALVKSHGINIMQCYLPVSYEDDISFTKNIGDAVRTLCETNSAAVPKKIPVLPEMVTFSMLEQKENCIALGLDSDEVVTQYCETAAMIQLIIGPPQSGKTNILKLFLEQSEKDRIFIADSKSYDLQDYQNKENVTYVVDAQDIQDFYDKLDEMVTEREQLFRENGNGMRPREYYSTLPAAKLIIDDIDNFIDIVSSISFNMETLITRVIDTGISIISTGLQSKLRGYDGITKILKDTQYAILLGNPTEQNIFTVPFMRGYKTQTGIGFIFARNAVVKIKIPLVKES